MPDSPRPLSLGEVRDLPAVISLPVAARALHLSRTSAYALARTGRFPVPIIAVGDGYRVPTAPIRHLLGIDPAPTP
jgi:hypothetical protein